MEKGNPGVRKPVLFAAQTENSSDHCAIRVTAKLHICVCVRSYVIVS